MPDRYTFAVADMSVRGEGGELGREREGGGGGGGGGDREGDRERGRQRENAREPTKTKTTQQKLSPLSLHIPPVWHCSPNTHSRAR